MFFSHTRIRRMKNQIFRSLHDLCYPIRIVITRTTKKIAAHLYSMRVMSTVQEHKIFALACVVLEEGRKGERGVGGAANIAPFFRE